MPDKKLRLRLAFLVFVFITFILLIFQPFGTYDFHDTNKYGKLLGYGIIGFITFSIAPSAFLKSFFKKELQTDSWTLLKELIILSLTVIIVNSISALYFYFVISSGAGLIAPLWQFQVWGFLILVFPVAGYLYFLHSSGRELKMWEKTEGGEVLTISGIGKGEIITVIKSEVLYLKASDNYVEVFLKKPLGVQKHILRASLASIYEQIKKADFVRVHRSYLVNTFCRPELVTENGNYEICFTDCNIKVPVSKTYLKEFRKKLSEIPL
jgi:hypothetical protein